MANQYGWAKDDILNKVYLDELYYLVKFINQRKLVDYQMQLAITQNPYTKDPKNLWKALRKDLINNDDDFDPAGMEILKARLGKNPKFKIK